LLVDIGESTRRRGAGTNFDRRNADFASAKKERFIERLKATGLSGRNRRVVYAV
jgi:hypothetical protein